MNNTDEEWGLLSVADVLEDNVPPQRVDETAVAPRVDELDYPLMISGSVELATTRAKDLIGSIRVGASRCIVTMEELYTLRVEKLKQALTASERIRERLMRTRESLSSAVAGDVNDSGVFEIIALLATGIGGDPDVCCDALLEGVSYIDWDLASSPCCLEVLNALQRYLKEEKCSPGKRSRILSTKLLLALRSERLSAIVQCLLLPGSTETLTTPFEPPFTPSPVKASNSGLDGFLTRMCALPVDVETKKSTCFSCGDTLLVSAGKKLFQFTPLGMMRTRSRQESGCTIHVDHRDTVLFRDSQRVIAVKALGRQESRLRYSLREVYLSDGRRRRSSVLSVNTAGLGVSNARCRFAMDDDGTLTCLLCSSTVNATRCRSYVASAAVEAVLSGAVELSFDVDRAGLLRDPAISSAPMAFHFSPSTEVALGRVTLKDHFEPFCIELWVYPRSFVNPMKVLSIGSKSDEVIIEIVPAHDSITFLGGARTPQLGTSSASYSVLGKLSSAERWWHVALNFTGTTWELWLDNHVVSRSEALVSPEAIKDAQCTLGKAFVGFLAEVRVWNRTRSCEELYRDAYRPLRGSEEGLCAYFPLNEREGELLADYASPKEHTLLGYNAGRWSEVPSLPVPRQPEARLIGDFVPHALVEQENDLFFCTTPQCYCIAVHAKGHAVVLFFYRRCDRTVASQVRIEMRDGWHLSGVAYDAVKSCVVCWSWNPERKENKLMLWDVYYCEEVPHFAQREYDSVWLCGREVLLQAASYAERFLSELRYLADQSAFGTSISSFAVDAAAELIPSLLRLTMKAVQMGDAALAQSVCSLLQANLFFRHVINARSLAAEVGDVHLDVKELLDYVEDPAAVDTGVLAQLIRLAFEPVAVSTGLLRTCCQCFLTEEARVAFIDAAVRRSRSENEEKLLQCLLESYSTSHACDQLVKTPARVQLLYEALFEDMASRTEAGFNGEGLSALRRSSRCLEFVQEILFAKTADATTESTRYADLSIRYVRTLLHVCTSTMVLAKDYLLKNPEQKERVVRCLANGHVASLLPSLTVSLPFQPTAVLEVCAEPPQVGSAPMDACWMALESLADAMDGLPGWLDDIGLGLKYSLCHIGCTLLNTGVDSPAESADKRYYRLLQGGLRKPRTERDNLITGLQQGVGPLAKAFDDLLKRDATALSVRRDDDLRRIERHIMAAFCTLLIPTKELREGREESLAQAFRHVQKMRIWVLSKRQQSKEDALQVERRAVFLARYDTCCRVAVEPQSLLKPRSHDQRDHKADNSRLWRQFFKQWKALRDLKTFLTTMDSADTTTQLANSIVEFLQSDVDCAAFSRVVTARAKIAKYRHTGLAVLKRLLVEARSSTRVARRVLPVMAKKLCGWHYADNLERCSSETLSRLRTGMFVLFCNTLEVYLAAEEKPRRPWTALVVALMATERGIIDFRKTCVDEGAAFRLLWGAQNRRRPLFRRHNLQIPSSLYDKKLSSSQAAPHMTVGASGLTLRSCGGRGTAVAPCEWVPSHNQYYYEVYVVDLLPGSSCMIGVGPADYSLTRLPGWDPNSCALQSDDGYLFSGTSQGRSTGVTFGLGDVVGCGWDPEKATLFWTKNGVTVLKAELEAQVGVRCPLLGIDGIALLKVNFGAEPFVAQVLPFTRKPSGVSRFLEMEGWDAFRVLSLRACCSLREACTLPDTPAESIKELMDTVQFCFKTLGQEIRIAYQQVLVGNSTVSARALLCHCSCLTSLLRTVQKDYVTSAVSSVAEAIEACALDHLKASKPPDAELLTVVLESWYNVMYLVPPPTLCQRGTETSRRSSIPPALVFLQVLLTLARRLSGVFHEEPLKGSRSFSIAFPEWTDTEATPWVALALLQRVLRVDAVMHPWEAPLREWMTAVVARTTRPSKDLLLVLSILGGTPRLAVLGDTITARRTKHATLVGTMISYSLSEEVCSAYTDQNRQVLWPLRSVDLVVRDDLTREFPRVGNEWHTTLSEHLVSCAVRLLENVTSTTGGPATAVLQSELLSILWRCVTRKVVSLPPSLFTALMQLSDVVETGTIDARQLRVEKVMIEHCGMSLRRGTVVFPLPLQGDQSRSEVFISDTQRGAVDGSGSLSGPELFARPPHFAYMGPIVGGGGSVVVGGGRVDMPRFTPGGANVIGSHARDEDTLGANDVDGLLLVGNDGEEVFQPAFTNTITSGGGGGDLDMEDSDMDTDLIQFGGQRGDMGTSGGTSDADDADDDDDDDDDDAGEGPGFLRGTDLSAVEAYEGVHFDHGYLYITTNRPVGHNFTIDLQIRLPDLEKYQVLFFQPSVKDPLDLVARVRNGKVEFGWVECAEDAEPKLVEDSTYLVQAPLSDDDVGRWIRLSFVQSGTTVSVYKRGLLLGSKKTTRDCGDPLLQSPFYLGAAYGDISSYLQGDMKEVRIYEIALRPNMVEQLYNLQASLSTFVESHLCLLLRGHREGFVNSARTPAALTTLVRGAGNVTYLEDSLVEVQKADENCLPEVDFGTETEEMNLFDMDVTTAKQLPYDPLTVWRKKRSQSLEVLLQGYARCGRLLSAYYSVCLLAELLRARCVGGDGKGEKVDSTVELPPRIVQRTVEYTLLSGDAHLNTLLEKMMRQIVLAVARGVPRGDTPTIAPATVKDDVGLGDEALRSILAVAQQEQRSRVYESPHPFKPASRQLHEIYAPGENYYELYFDQESLQSNMLLTFALDRNLINVMGQAPGFGLSAFSTTLSRLFFEVRSDGSTPQWGYKVDVVFHCRAQLRAMRLFRALLSEVLEETGNITCFPALVSPESLKQLSVSACCSTGKTRRLTLSCLTDLLLHSDKLALTPAFFTRIHELRHMAERQCQRDGVDRVGRSRFVQAVVASYLLYQDTAFIRASRRGALGLRSTLLSEDAAAASDAPPSAESAREEFQRRRQEQREWYRLRESNERIQLHKMTPPQTLHADWDNKQLVYTVQTEGSAGSFVAGGALKSGKWYFEVQMLASGDVFVGVMPGQSTGVQPDGTMGVRKQNPIAFNGLTGILLTTSVSEQRLALSSVWKSKDYVGVVLDMAKKACTFYVNGVETAVVFHFGANEGHAASALAVGGGGGDEQSEDDMLYYPIFALERFESAVFNFGTTHFRYDPPRGCLPLDPTNLGLETKLPFNHMRAFQDLSAHVLTAGRHPLPPYFYEEADPFADSKERSGPAHVSLHGDDGVQINLLEARNNGNEFATVTADCAVRAGMWFYEVTLRSYGLMQIGWMIKGGPGESSVGDTATSWAVDLFRCLKWHNGKPEPIKGHRRWGIGDVIGCALDLTTRVMVFYANGKPIVSVDMPMCTFDDLPTSESCENGLDFEYVPAVSLRAGNSVQFNFGSATFRSKPDGYNPLGISDSWKERMDTFYANEKVAVTVSRHRVLEELWQALGRPREPASTECRAALQPYLQVVSAVDTFCKANGKHYNQVSAASLEEALVQQGCTEQGVLSSAATVLSVLLAITRVAKVVIPFVLVQTEHTSIMTKLLLTMRAVLFGQLRAGLVDAMLKETNSRNEHFRISINRRRAQEAPTSMKASVFGQTLAVVADQHPRLFQTSKRFWSTAFMGEGAEDAGGPFREHISEMCRELMSTRLPLFVPTANNAHNVGSHRDAFVPAASACGDYELHAFVFLGELMGGAMRTEEPLSLYLPPLVWKYLCCSPITESDVEDIDRMCVQCAEEFRNLRNQPGSQEVFDEVFDAQYFVSKLSDGTTKELIPDGTNIRVTYERCEEFAAALLHARLHEFDLQLSKIREGMLLVVPETALVLLSPTELEHLVCGRPDYDVEELRKGAIFEGITSEDRRVTMLWQALAEATPLQRRLFLRFVSGRDRLPVKLRVIPLSTPNDPDSLLPRAATCFFAIELPDYSSLEVMKRKLYYSIENCQDIDTDFQARPTDETEGPHLMIGIEELRHDDVVNALMRE